MENNTFSVTEALENLRKKEIEKEIPLYNGIKEKFFVYPPSQEVIYNVGQSIANPHYRASYYFEYLTGCRISEGLMLRFGDIETKKIGHKAFKIVKLTTLKNRKQRVRMIPIPLFKEYEKKMWDEFAPFYEHSIDKVFKSINTRFAINDGFKKIKLTCDSFGVVSHSRENREIRLHPHLLRHFRLTHLVTLYNFTDTKLTDFAGWTSSVPARIYVTLSPQNLMEAFISSKGG